MQLVTDYTHDFPPSADNLKKVEKIQHHRCKSLIGEFKFLFYFNKINIKGFLKVSTTRWYQHFSHII